LVKTQSVNLSFSSGPFFYASTEDHFFIAKVKNCIYATGKRVPWQKSGMHVMRAIGWEDVGMSGAWAWKDGWGVLAAEGRGALQEVWTIKMGGLKRKREFFQAGRTVTHSM